MTQSFKVDNVKCGGCANTLKTKLEPLFGDITVNLEQQPREITLDIDAERIEALRSELKALGYPMSDETLGFIDNQSAKAKSFVSCAVGKIDLARKS